jgi:hypothetical protein
MKKPMATPCLSLDEVRAVQSARRQLLSKQTMLGRLLFRATQQVTLP